MDELSSLLSPEEEELARKQTELANVLLQVGDKEARLAALQTSLEAFQAEYLQVVAPCMAEMEEIKTAAAGKKEEGDEALSCATALQRDDCPPGELKLLFREVAKSVHPDLAPSDEERLRRDEMMAHANAAYAEGNQAQLRDLLLRFKGDPHGVQGEGVAFDLVRVIRRMAQARNRLEEIRLETRELQKSDLYFLRQRADRAHAEGRNLLQEMRANLERQIEQQRARVAQMK